MKELPVSLNLEATAADLARLACRAMALIVKVRYILTHGKTHYNTYIVYTHCNTNKNYFKCMQIFDII